MVRSLRRVLLLGGRLHALSGGLVRQESTRVLVAALLCPGLAQAACPLDGSSHHRIEDVEIVGADETRVFDSPSQAGYERYLYAYQNTSTYSWGGFNIREVGNGETELFGYVSTGSGLPSSLTVRVTRYCFEDGSTEVIDITSGQTTWASFGSLVVSRGQPDEDADMDGIPNSADLDDDGDGLPDAVDWDLDGDGVANLFDSDFDTDGDGVANKVDTDDDDDGIPDVTDTDDDGNGLADATEAQYQSMWYHPSDYSCDASDPLYDADYCGEATPTEVNPCGENGELCGGPCDDSDGDGINNHFEPCSDSIELGGYVGVFLFDYDGDGLGGDVVMGDYYPGVTVDEDIDGDGVVDWIPDGLDGWTQNDLALPAISYKVVGSNVGSAQDVNPTGGCGAGCCYSGFDYEDMSSWYKYDRDTPPDCDLCADGYDDDDDGIDNAYDVDCNADCADDDNDGECDSYGDEEPADSDCACSWLKKIHDVLDSDLAEDLDAFEEVDPGSISFGDQFDIAAAADEDRLLPDLTLPGLPSGGGAWGTTIDIPIGTGGWATSISTDFSQWGGADTHGILYAAEPAFMGFAALVRVVFQLMMVHQFLRRTAAVFHST